MNLTPKASIKADAMSMNIYDIFVSQEFEEDFHADMPCIPCVVDANMNEGLPPILSFVLNDEAVSTIDELQHEATLCLYERNNLEFDDASKTIHGAIHNLYQNATEAKAKFQSILGQRGVDCSQAHFTLSHCDMAVQLKDRQFTATLSSSLKVTPDGNCATISHDYVLLQYTTYISVDSQTDFSLNNLTALTHDISKVSLVFKNMSTVECNKLDNSQNANELPARFQCKFKPDSRGLGLNFVVDDGMLMVNPTSPFVEFSEGDSGPAQTSNMIFGGEYLESVCGIPVEKKSASEISALFDQFRTETTRIGFKRIFISENEKSSITSGKKLLKALSQKPRLPSTAMLFDNSIPSPAKSIGKMFERLYSSSDNPQHSEEQKADRQLHAQRSMEDAMRQANQNFGKLISRTSTSDSYDDSLFSEPNPLLSGNELLPHAMENKMDSNFKREKLKMGLFGRIINGTTSANFISNKEAVHFESTTQHENQNRKSDNLLDKLITLPIVNGSSLTDSTLDSSTKRSPSKFWNKTQASAPSVNKRKSFDDMLQDLDKKQALYTTLDDLDAISLSDVIGHCSRRLKHLEELTLEEPRNEAWSKGLLSDNEAIQQTLESVISTIVIENVRELQAPTLRVPSSTQCAYKVVL